MTDETKNNGKGVSDGQNGENTGKLRMVKGKAGKSRKNASENDFDALAAIQSADGTPIEAFFDVVESNSGLAAGVSTVWAWIKTALSIGKSPLSYPTLSALSGAGRIWKAWNTALLNSSATAKGSGKPCPSALSDGLTGGNFCEVWASA